MGWHGHESITRYCFGVPVTLNAACTERHRPSWYALATAGTPPFPPPMQSIIDWASTWPSVMRVSTNNDTWHTRQAHRAIRQEKT